MCRNFQLFTSHKNPKFTQNKLHVGKHEVRVFEGPRILHVKIHFQTAHKDIF